MFTCVDFFLFSWVLCLQRGALVCAVLTWTACSLPCLHVALPRSRAAAATYRMKKVMRLEQYLNRHEILAASCLVQKACATFSQEATYLRDALSARGAKNTNFCTQISYQFGYFSNNEEKLGRTVRERSRESCMHAVGKAATQKDARSAVENCVCGCGTRSTLPTCRSVSLYTAISARRAR